MQRNLLCPKCGSSEVIFVSSNTDDKTTNGEAFYTCSNCSFSGERIVYPNSISIDLIKDKAGKGWIRASNKYIKTNEMIDKVMIAVKSFNDLVNTVNNLAGRMMIKTNFDNLKAESLLQLINEINQLDGVYNKFEIIKSGFEKATNK